MDISDEDLARLLAAPESDEHERKAELTPAAKRSAREAICAFANDLTNRRAPGVLVVGVDDEGSPTGLEIDDRLLRRLNDFAKDGSIVPPPLVFVQRRHHRGAEIAVVLVAPHSAPPVRLDGTVFVRSGPATTRARPEEERLLNERRRGADIPFDARPIASASLSDLDLAWFQESYLPRAVSPEVLAENQRSQDHQLRSLRLAGELDGRLHPTAVGILLLARDPTWFLPGAYVDFIRIEGTVHGGTILDQARFGGPLHELIHSVEAKLRAHIRDAVDLTGPVEVRHRDYPFVALREVFRNAVTHRSYEGTHAPVRVRWYDDRVEVDSPGPLFGVVTRERFGEPGVTDYRNAHVAEVMRNLGLVNRFGYGIALANQALAENGSPTLGLDPHPTQVVVRVLARTT